MIVEHRIIPAQPSTRNAERKRDPKIGATRKGNNLRFGMKAQVGADADGGLVRTVVVSATCEGNISIGATCCTVTSR